MCQPTVNIDCRYRLRRQLPTIDCPRGVAPVRMPKADATETGSKEIGQSNPSRTHSPVREGAGISWPPFFKNKSWHFFGEVSRAEALGLNREGRPAAFAGRSKSGLFWLGYRCCLREKVSYPLRQTLRQPEIPSEGQKIRKLRSQLSPELRVQRAGPVTRNV